MNDNGTKPTGLALLRQPFAPNQISKMCRSTKKENPKGKCPKCGGWHGLPAVQLSYVGHAALTDRLLEADPEWNWEPLAVDEKGYPLLDRDGGMWIRLTVCGVTRLGYGDAQNRTGADGMKERIGDCLRNAAMRFGAALDLWHKGDLHVDEGDEEPPKSNGKSNSQAAEKPPTAWPEVLQRAEAAIAKTQNANECSQLLDKLVKTFEKAPDATHDTPLRRMADHLLALAADSKVDERAAQALTEVIRGRLRDKSAMEEFQEEAAGVF